MYSQGGKEVNLEKNKIRKIIYARTPELEELQVKDELKKFNQEKLKKIKKKDERFSRLCELNVMEQATHVCETTVVQDAWKKGQQLSVHAVIYDIHDGLLKKLWSKVGPK